MESLKALVKSILSSIYNFLKYKKHIYFKPLFILVIALIIVFVSVYIYKNLLHEEEEKITMDFSNEEEKVTYDLSGVTVALDPGHGGEDPGAPSNYGENEKTVVLSIAEKLQESLIASGAEVVMTRNGDETKSLDERKVDADLFISLHSDAFDDPSISGFTTFYTYPNQEAFGQHLNQALDKHSFLYNRGNQTMNYQVTWQLDYPGVLIELGYLSNQFDDYILNDEAYQDEMSDAIIEGIDSYVHR